MEFEKSCGCIIIDEGKVLLVKQVEGHWGFPKGHVEENETEVQTAIREVKEETNIDVEVNQNYRYEENYITDRGNNKTVIYFLAKKISNDIINQECEVEEVKWFTVDEALKTITYDNSRELLKKALLDIK